MSLWASITACVPLLGSSPIDRRPTLGRSMPSISWAKIWPSTANWRSPSGRTSALAPASKNTTGSGTAGSSVQRAGRRTPLDAVDVQQAGRQGGAGVAHRQERVGPAVGHAAGRRRPATTRGGCARPRPARRPSRSCRSPPRSRCAGGRRPAGAPRGVSGGPTSRTRSSSPAAWRAPSTTASGAWSPPSASTATRTTTPGFWTVIAAWMSCGVRSLVNGRALAAEIGDQTVEVDVGRDLVERSARSCACRATRGARTGAGCRRSP